MPNAISKIGDFCFSIDLTSNVYVENGASQEEFETAAIVDAAVLYSLLHEHLPQKVMSNLKDLLSNPPEYAMVRAMAAGCSNMRYNAPPSPEDVPTGV